jgi:hypothetical protein
MLARRLCCESLRCDCWGLLGGCAVSLCGAAVATTAVRLLGLARRLCCVYHCTVAVATTAGGVTAYARRLCCCECRCTAVATAVVRLLMLGGCCCVWLLLHAVRLLMLGGCSVSYCRCTSCGDYCGATFDAQRLCCESRCTAAVATFACGGTSDVRRRLCCYEYHCTAVATTALHLLMLGKYCCAW